MNPFYRLAPFIQDYIYRQKWETLRPAQIQAIQAILDTRHHVLISSGTATGKTEAALLPILTELHNNPSTTIGAVYVGPLKALINDQFERLQGMLDETDTPVQSWHGDVSQSKKARFLQKAQGILQITPESLEAMLINHHYALGRIFGDLRFVIIDEVHTFIESDRGQQVICQLQRLARYQSTPARRIGLSATISEPEKAMAWLAGGTSNQVTLVEDKQSREVEIGLEYFIVPDHEEVEGIPEPEQREEVLASDMEVTYDEAFFDRVKAQRAVDEHLYTMTQRAHKTLIFANRRGSAEKIITHLRRLADDRQSHDFYHVHHGSIARVLREAAEDAMRDPERKACTAATLTLELGIDIGRLDQVLQINSTHSVSSFVQRLGRSGRRDNPARMFFYSQDQPSSANPTLGEQIPWNLIQTIAIIQLYIEERWVEPPRMLQLPLSLLYHQTMSAITAYTELMPAQLAEQILTLSHFVHVTQDQYRELLRHLIEIGHLEMTEIGGLIIGLQGEKIINNYRFYATFEDEVAFQVREKSREIGFIQSPPEVNTTIGLAGYAWRVNDVSHEQRIVHVERVRGKAPAAWCGGSIELHTRILQRMRQVLREATDYGYLHERAQKRLAEARSLAQATGLTTDPILHLGANRYMILPWQGTRTFNTLLMLLETSGFDIRIDKVPFYFELSNGEESVVAMQRRMYESAINAPSATDLAATVHEDELKRAKYDRYLPVPLLRQAFACDYLDVEGALSCLRAMAH